MREPGDAAPDVEVSRTGAALLVVDGKGNLVRSAGWARCFGDEPPSRLAVDAGSADGVQQRLAAVISEARRLGRPVGRLISVDLDRRRLYALSAGPTEGAAGAARNGAPGRRRANGGGSVAVIAMECTGGTEGAPREGDAIRQLAHDLRTPLASMSGAVEMLESQRFGAPTPEQARLLRLLAQGVHRMLEMIDEAAAPYRAAARARAAGEG